MSTTKIIKEDVSCLIDNDRTELMESLCIQYMGKQIFDVNLYKYVDDVDYKLCSHDVIDFNTGKLMSFADYHALYEDSIYSKRNRYLYTEIIDDLLVVFISFCPTKTDDAISQNYGYREYLKVETIQFYKKDKSCITAKWNNGNIEYLSREEHGLNNLANSLSFLFSYGYGRKYNAKNFMDTIFSFFGIQPIKGEMVQICNIKALSSWWTLKELRKPSKEIQELNNLISEYEVDDDVFQYQQRSVLVEVHNDVVVFRFLEVLGFNTSSKVYEVFRVFFKDGKMCCLRRSAAYGFCKERRELPKVLDKWRIQLMPSGIIDIVPFKYILPLYKADDDGFQCVMNLAPSSTTEFFGMFSNSMLEKFAKGGMLPLVSNISNLSRYMNSGFDKAFSAVFGVLGDKSNIKSYLGLNQYQINCVKNSYINKDIDTPEWKYPIIRAIKYIMNMDNISSIDDITFQKLFKFVEFHNPWQAGVKLRCVYENENLGSFTYYVETIARMYRYYDDINVSLDIINQINSMLTITTIYRFIDIFKMAKQMKDVGLYHGNPIKSSFSSYSEFHDSLATVHDNLVLLLNTYQEKLDSKTYDEMKPELVNKWKKYEYCGDLFKVVYPHCPLDIVKEGTALHHCVKSFIPSVNAGETNILFIRRIDDDQTPFFTVEIDRHGTIRQIHGLCNCNVNTVDGLSEFVSKWMREKKIKKGEYNRVLA